MTNQSKLKKIYEKIPKIECKKSCAASCSVIMMSDAEHKVIKNKTGISPSFCEKTGSCNLLKENHCMAYDVRPLICRLFGVVEAMRCPHGCIPERFISDEEAEALIKATKELGMKKSKAIKTKLRRFLKKESQA